MSLGDRSGPPRVAGVELIQDLSGVSSPILGFLRRHRHRVKTTMTDGTRTDTYVVDYVDRAQDRRDAVAVVAYQPAADGDPLGATVLLRAQLRYPAWIVTGQPTLLEVVAGLIEGGEAPASAAIRELYEEAGVHVAAGAARTVGGVFFPSPGILTERMSVVAVELAADAFERAEPIPGDGSEMEKGAELLTMSLADALALTDRGGTDDELQIADAKTEIALFRLKQMLEQIP